MTLEFGVAECPDLTFTKTSPVGDQSASITIPYRGGSPLPRGDSPFAIEDEDIGPIWSGFTGPLDPPDLANCNGNATIKAIGGGASMLKRSEEERVYGPRWQHAVLGDPSYAIEGAVKHVVSQLAPNVILQNANVLSSGVTLQETENFIGQCAGDVLNSLAARTQHLATPCLWHVRQGVFDWRTMDLAPRYQILMANGAKVKPRYDPARVVNRVIVGWGKSTEQTAIWPETISYTKRQIIADLYINAGAEVKDYATAFALAQGIYARMLLLSPEWSLDISIPGSCPVQELVDGMWTDVKTVGMEPGFWLRIPDLDQGGLGPELEVPQGGYMTRVSWQNKTSTMSVSVGEPRSAGAMTRLARRVVTAGASPLNIWGYLGRDLSTPNRDVAKTQLLGPQLTTTPDQTKPPPVDYQTPAVSTEHKTTLPETHPPQPPAFGYQINTPQTVGRKFAIPVEPMVLEKFSLIASGPSDARIRISRVSNNAVVIPSAEFQGSMTRLEVLITPNWTIEKPDHLWVEIISADTLLDADTGWCEITFRSRRYYPGYPGDRAPKTGVRF